MTNYEDRREDEELERELQEAVMFDEEQMRELEEAHTVPPKVQLIRNEVHGNVQIDYTF